MSMKIIHQKLAEQRHRNAAAAAADCQARILLDTYQETVSALQRCCQCAVDPDQHALLLKALALVFQASQIAMSGPRAMAAGGGR